MIQFEESFFIEIDYSIKATFRMISTYPNSMYRSATVFAWPENVLCPNTEENNLPDTGNCCKAARLFVGQNGTILFHLKEAQGARGVLWAL